MGDSEQGSRLGRVATWLWLATLATFVGLIVWGWFAPLVSDMEYEAALDEVNARRVRAGRATCSRTALGEADPLTQREFQGGVLSLAACFRMVDYQLFQDPVVRVELEDTAEPEQAADANKQYWSWVYDPGEQAAQTGPSGEEYAVAYNPPTPSGHVPLRVRQARESCAQLDEFLERVASSTSLCALPAALSGGIADVQTPMSIAHGAAVLAREAYGGGEAARAFRILENALVAVRDLRRGPSGWLSAMTAVAAQGVILAHYQTLLLGEVPLSSIEWEDRHRRLRTLAADAPTPEDYLEYDLVALETHLDPSYDPDRLGLLMAARDGGRGEMPAHESLALWTERGYSVDLPTEVHNELYPRRIFRPFAIARADAQNTAAIGTYLSRVAGSDVALEVFQDLVRAASERGPCPPATNFEPIAGAVGSTTIRHFSGDLYEVVGPRQADVRFRDVRSAFTLICPAATTGWQRRATSGGDAAE